MIIIHTVACSWSLFRISSVVADIPNRNAVVIPSGDIYFFAIMMSDSRSKNKLIMGFPPDDAFVPRVELL